MPAELKDRLDAAAVASNRSLTAEVISRLQITFVEHEHAALIRSLVYFQEHLLESAFDLSLPEETWSQLEAAAERRGWTVQKLVNALISGALHHLDEKTELGKKLEAHLYQSLAIEHRPADDE